MSDGPWRKHSAGWGDRYNVTRDSEWIQCENIDEAEAKCDELNQIARREAASEQLLAACRAVTVKHNSYRRPDEGPCDCHLCRKCLSAIRAAEGEEARR